MLKPFVSLVLLLSLAGCSSPKQYHLLYPIQASKQEVLRLDGFRFLSSESKSPIALMILSNPIEDASFVDVIFAYQNNGKQTINITPKDISIKMRGVGELSLLSKEEYQKGEGFKKPEGFDNLTPKMKAYGCAAPSSKDNTSVATLSLSQKWVWDEHMSYPFKDDTLYLENLRIKPGEMKGALIRFKLPKTDENFEQSTLLIKFTLEDKIRNHFKFILQSLK